jgi:hypothetical protein
MNEQAILASYDLAVQNGYKKSIDDFKQLLSSNGEALNVSYNLALQNGYKKTIEDYKVLMGLSTAQEPIEQPAEVEKKNVTTESPSEDGSLASSESADNLGALAVEVQDESILTKQPREAKTIVPSESTKPISQRIPQVEPQPDEIDKKLAQIPDDKKGGQSYVENLFTNLGLGAAYFNEGIASIPETAINLLAIPQNFVAEKTGWDIGVSAEGIKKSWGITNPLLDYVQEDKKILSGEVSKFIADRYEDPSVVGNFEKGNYKDGFELLGSAIAQSLPTSIALMAGGAKMTPAQLAALSTIVFTEGQRQELAEMDPTMPEAEKTFKAVSMAAMEGVFSSLGTGTIGKVYKDILKREGAEAAPRILKDGLVAAYTKALEKMGPVAGFLGNSIEETAVQISQNVIAGRPAFEGAADAFVIGGGQGVVFTAPIGAINAKKYVQGKVESYQTKDKIGQILKEKADDIDNLYNVPVSSEITAQQLEISNLPKSREILVNRLKKAVADNKITENDAKQSLFVFDKTQQVSNAVKDLDITLDDKAKIATLLRQRDDLKTKIQNKDDVLVVQEKQRIEDINNQIEQILLKPKEDAIQEQAAGEVPVQSGATVSEEVAQGEPQAEPQVTAETGKEEVNQEEVVKGLEQYINDNPTKIKEVTGGAELSGGLIDLMLAAQEADKKQSVTEPTKIDFLPETISLVHLARNKNDLNSILENGFDVNRVSIESPVPGVYFSSEDWSTMDRFGREKGNAISSQIKNDGLVYFDNSNDFVKFLNDNNLPSRGETLTSEQVNSLKEKGIKGIVLREDFASQSKNELIVLDPSIIQSTKKYEGEQVTELPPSFSNTTSIANAYKKSKANGTNPEFVNKVEEALSPAVSPAVSQTTLTQQEQLAQMEQMFAEEATPTIQPVQFEGATVSDPIQVESLKKRVQDKGKKAVVDFAQKTLTTLKSVLPDFEIVVHDDDNSYANAMSAVNGNAQSSGYFSYIQRPDGTYVGKIDINLNKANNATVAHEVAHGVMRKAFGENVESFRTLKNRIAAVLNTEGNQALTDFANQYEENDSYEEYLVELAAQLTQAEKNLSPTLLQKIASIINEAVSKITNGAFTPFQNIRDTKQTIEFFRNISESIRKGEAINPADITAIQEGLSVPIGSPTTINPAPKGKASLNFTKTPLPLSFVTESDKIDINALIDDIVAKKQKIWFWMADQLGRGNYYDEVIEGQHYLDAGPSFALDPENRSKGILWASGLPEKTLTNQINQADYIFFISGSPEKAKLFNKRVLDLLAERINKTSNFDKFKEAINKFTKETVELRTIKDALNGVNSFKELADSPKRKPFLISIGEIGALKTAPAGSLKELLGSFNAFIDYNELRDGFYKENDFNQNDIMLVGKPTGVSGKAPHSTYEFAISGEVVGVPDKKIDSWDIMPEAIKEKYKDVIGGREEKTKPMQTKVIAAETGVIRELESRVKGKAQLIGQNAKLGAVVKYNLGIAKELTSEGENPQKIRIETGWEQGKDKKWRYEIPDGKFKNFDINDLKIEKDIEDDAEIRVSILGDVFDSPDLYAAYPELKGIRVMFKKLPENVAGSYNPYTNAITISIDDYLDPAQKEESELTMIHELQHAIQSKEYFERGGTEKIAQSFFDNLISDLKYDVDRKKEIYERAKAIFPNDKKKQQASRDLFKYALEKYTLLEQLGNRKETKANKKILAEWAKIAKEQGIKLPPKVKSRLRITPADSYNLYRRLAGEVEARNVEFRRSLTPAERRNTLLSETEEIDRADQLMLDNPDMMFEGIDEMNQQFKGKAQLDTDAKAKKVVQQARAQGFSEDAIQLFLEGKGLSKQAIGKAMAKETPAAGRIKLSEETIKGYDSLMKKIDTLIESGTPSKEVISKLKNSKTYTESTDVQKETLFRETRKKLGLRQKSAPTVKRLFGQLKDITKITMTETELLKKRIREIGEGAKLAKKSIAEANKFLADEIKEMANKGKITDKQAAAIVVKVLKMNPLSEASISRFVDYLAKVFSNAEYVAKMTTALGQIKQAKKNIITKIGVSEDLFEPLNQLLSINPTLIPLNQLEKYLGILKDFGARKAVLSVADRVKVLKQVNEILDEINNELSLVDVLADRFNNYEGKVFSEDGLNYASTIKDMIDNGAITVDESELMKKYKSEILPQVEPTKLTDEEIKELKKEEIDILKKLKISDEDFPLPSRDEKEDAINLAKLIKELSVEDLMNLSLPDLKNMIKVIDNINNGYLPHYAKVSIEKLDAIKQGKVLSGAIERAKPLSFSKLYSRLKDKFTKKGEVDELIRANPLYYIDNVFGDFKTRDIFNSLLEKSSQALATFNSELKRVDQKIEAAQNKVLASFKQNSEEYLMSKFRMTAYMLQREYESNIGKKGVKPVAEYLKETIKHIRLGRSIYKKADAEKLEKILKEVKDYTVDGKVDLDKFYNTFNSAEKNAIKEMTEINGSLGEKAAYTAAVVRGDKVELMDNYVHHNVLHEQNPMDATAAPEFSDKYKNSMKPSTKAKSLIERTDTITPLNFDLFTATHKGAKFILLDYNLTSPIRTARRTLIQAEKNLESKGLMNNERVQIFNAINNAYEEALQNILTNNITQDAFANEVVDFIQKQGYRAALAGTTRFQAELASNIANALLINPAAFTEGAKNMKLIASANGYEFMKNAKSKQTSRLYASDALSGKMVDPQILKQTSGIKGSVSRGALTNRTLQVYNLTLKKYVQNPVEYIADTLLSTPDKIVSMPLWFGSFMNEFKRITGEDVNQDMMINNDLDYMQKYSDAIQQATRKADQESVYSGASNNEFMGILKGKLKPNQGLTAKIWNNFNTFMTNFMNFDYAAARSAVYNLFNEGYMTKKKAAAVLAGITTRSVIYQVMVANMGAGIVGAAFGLAFDWEDEEEVNEKSYLQMLGRGLANVLVGYTVGRNFGNAVRGMLNFGVEQINEEYLDFLRNGEYDFYKDNIAYTYLNVGDRGDVDVAKMAVNMAGPYTPALNTAVLIGKNFGSISNRVMGKGPTKKEPEAIRREQMTVDYRIPLELAGNAGLIPLYKDVKKAVNDEIYKDLRKAANTPESSLPSTEDYEKLKDLRELKSKTSNEDEIKEINKKIVKIVGSEESKESIEKAEDIRSEKKKRLLYDSSKGKRYDNESDMKRINPALWRRRFGPNSDWAKSNKAKNAVDNKLEKVASKREDKEFNKR